MDVVFALEPIRKFSEEPDVPIFLVGPTPRRRDIKSWRPEALEILEKAGFGGTIYVPEDRTGEYRHDYNFQVEWEHKALEHCRKHGAIIAWVPRDLRDMPAFTTNVEFGLYVTSPCFFYGRPNHAEKNRYLDWAYQKFRGEIPQDNLTDLVTRVEDYIY
jgi:hypothetical protein